MFFRSETRLSIMALILCVLLTLLAIYVNFFAWQNIGLATSALLVKYEADSECMSILNDMSCEKVLELDTSTESDENETSVESCLQLKMELEPFNILMALNRSHFDVAEFTTLNIEEVSQCLNHLNTLQQEVRRNIFCCDAYLPLKQALDVETRQSNQTIVYSSFHKASRRIKVMLSSVNSCK